MGKKKKPLPPKVKRMKRVRRLAAAKAWMTSYSGKNVLRGYCTHFAVDWRCAAAELQMLGVKLDPAYLAQRVRTEAEQSRKRIERRRKQQADTDQHWHPYTDPVAAYLAGDFEALHDLEQRQAYIDKEERDCTDHHP